MEGGEDGMSRGGTMGGGMVVELDLEPGEIFWRTRLEMGMLSSWIG